MKKIVQKSWLIFIFVQDLYRWSEARVPDRLSAKAPCSPLVPVGKKKIFINFCTIFGNFLDKGSKTRGGPPEVFSTLLLIWYNHLHHGCCYIYIQTIHIYFLTHNNEENEIVKKCASKKIIFVQTSFLCCRHINILWNDQLLIGLFFVVHENVSLLLRNT